MSMTYPRTRIRELRKSAGFTLKELAEKIGTTPQTVQRLETDNMTVSAEWLERFAAIFGLPMAELLERVATTPEQNFIDELRATLIQARRHSPVDKAPLALVEAVGILAQRLIEHEHGLPWEKVQQAFAIVAASAVRIAIDAAPRAVTEPIKLVVNQA